LIFEKAKADTVTMKYLTRLSLEDWNLWAGKFQDRLINSTVKGQPRTSQRGRHRSFDELEALFATLLWARFNIPMELLGNLWNKDKRTASEWVHFVIPVLDGYFSLHPEISWPSDKEMEEHVDKFKQMGLYDPKFGPIAAAVDGFEVKIPRPGEKELRETHWSVKKHQFSANVLLLVLLTGEIIYMSEASESHSDQHIWNELDIRAKFIGKKFGVISDSGFTLNPTRKQRIWGVESPGGGPNSENRDLWFRAARLRAIVENVISDLRNWQIFSTKFRNAISSNGKVDFDFLNQCLRVFSNLLNYRLKKNPKRGVDGSH
jgi:hypothetical protein